ncbi:MAG: type VI secretion system baseplate subunit TssK [Planctomycetota bacterium]
MGLYDRVLWEEGMFLGPQHFQQQDRHHGRQLRQSLQALHPHGFGLLALAVDEEALQGGEFALHRVAGVFEDGTAIDAPELDPLPSPRPLKDVFGARETSLRVSLAIATARTGSMLQGDRDDGTPGRLRRAVVPVLDELKGALERDVAVGHANLRLVFEGESADGMQLLPLADIKRGAGSGYQLDPDFVPPVLYLSASPRLLRTVRLLLEYLGSQSEKLGRARGERIGGKANMTTVEAASFWLFYTLNTWLPLLTHHHQQQRTHPEALYRDLAALAGALCTFTPDARPRDVPFYDHREPGPVFRQLEKAIIDLASGSAPMTCESIRLLEKGEGEYHGQILDDTLLDNADFYLAVSADVSADVIIKMIPGLGKLGSPEGVAEARRRAVSGVKLVPLTVPPPEIPQRAGFHYFSIHRDDPKWQSVRDTRNVEFFAPLKSFPDMTVEMFAVRKSQK